MVGVTGSSPVSSILSTFPHFSFPASKLTACHSKEYINAMIERSPKTSRNVSFFGGCKCGGERSPGKKSGCNSITPDTPPKTPDLATYSQIEELQNGRQPTWNSPDIITNYMRPFSLLRETKVKIRNLSLEVSAINALVHYSTSAFGIGMRSEPRLSKVISVPPNSEVELSFPLDQSSFAGDPRTGVYFLIEHPFDEVHINNSGSQVMDIRYTSEIGRTFKLDIPLLNDSLFSREFKLSALASDILASITPSSYLFSPQEQKTATLTFQIPDFLHGTQETTVFKEVTVVARLANQELIGGATVMVGIDN